MGRKVWFPAVSGPLSAYAAGYGSWLRTRSYSRSAISDRLWQFDQLSRWLDREGLAVGELSIEQCERFAASRRAAGVVTLVAPQSMTLPLEYLRALGLTPAPAPPLPHGPVEELLADYSRYLLIERGLTPHTVFDAYVPAARLFLAGRGGPGGLRLDRLAPSRCEHVPGARVPEAQRVGSAGSGVRAAVVPALSAPGRADRGAAGVGAALDRGPAGSHAAAGPGAGGGQAAAGQLRPPQLVGRRDFAILLLLSRLGLRAGEVAGLQLDDVDWRRGLLLIRGKGGRYDELPLPDDVGQALVSYLRRRPRCQSRAVFVRVTAPRRELNRSTIGWVVRAACDRAGLPRVGAHRLRHTAATEMLRRGASLAEIGEVLRHREQKTTAIYAKVDRTALRPLARPWPTTRVGAP